MPLFHSEAIYYPSGIGFSRISERNQAGYYIRSYLLGFPYDSIYGMTGALVDSTTLARARSLALASAATYLAENDAYTYFDRLGDLIRTGPTGTNVGDLQVVVTAGTK